MTLHNAQGYCPLNVIVIACVTGAISEYSRIMFAQATHCRTGHWPPQEKVNAIRTTRSVMRRMRNR